MHLYQPRRHLGAVTRSENTPRALVLEPLTRSDAYQDQ